MYYLWTLIFHKWTPAFCSNTNFFYDIQLRFIFFDTNIPHLSTRFHFQDPSFCAKFHIVTTNKSYNFTIIVVSVNVECVWFKSGEALSDPTIKNINFCKSSKCWEIRKFLLVKIVLYSIIFSQVCIHLNSCMYAKVFSIFLNFFNEYTTNKGFLQDLLTSLLHAMIGAPSQSEF